MEFDQVKVHLRTDAIGQRTGRKFVEFALWVDYAIAIRLLPLEI